MLFFNYFRQCSFYVPVGNASIGCYEPIRIQSMATVSTMDTEAAVAQAIRMIAAGADLVRFAVQGESEAKNLGVIRERLNSKGYETPLIADIQFNAKAANIAAQVVEKVRINPGNFAPTQALLHRRFRELLRICKANETALRIGVNHGSLSEWIKKRYGATPEGMVASCMELLDICKEKSFYEAVVSVKSSNTAVMVKTVRLLVTEMKRKKYDFPLHLGVTEAGEGLDGRIKSAVGIGALLADGFGDTIRVSLSEAPEKELSVARTLVKYFKAREYHHCIKGTIAPGYNHVAMKRRISRRVGSIGGGQPPVVLSAEAIANETAALHFVPITYGRLTAKKIQALSADALAVAVLSSRHKDPVGEMRAALHCLLAAGCDVPVVLRRDYKEKDNEALIVKASADFGALLLDGFGDGLIMTNNGSASVNISRLLYGILQATRLRITHTEYISCPGCGRTQYDLQTTVAEIKAATSRLQGLKIGIMGCVVNGPGEMADADYGYVGAGRGRISLYKGKRCVLKNIPEAEAVSRLVQLIKSCGDWKETGED